MTGAVNATHDGGSSELQSPSDWLSSAGGNFTRRTDDMVAKTEDLLNRIGYNKYADEIRAEFNKPDIGIHPTSYRMSSLINDAARALQDFISALRKIEAR